MPTDTARAYARLVRFVARQTAAATPEIATMMAQLDACGAAIDRDGRFTVAAAQAAGLARALAGTAKLVQEQLLPEALHRGDQAATEQLRAAVEISLALARALVEKLADDPAAASFTLDLPDRPDRGAE